jgi:Txe/YoeB family toxin of Txe-Axe toxin-antitoxin module
MAAAKKAEKRHKTVSVAEQIGNNLAHAVSKVADNIPAADIKEDPKKYLGKFEKLEKDANEFLSSLRSLMGEDYDKEELTAPIKATIGEFIKNIKEKYVK